MFVGFLATPTMLALHDQETSTIIINEEEEHETHTSKLQLNEEEVKAIHSTYDITILLKSQLFHNFYINQILTDDLVVKIPSPPPEFC